MASLTAHLVESGGHGRLGFHPSCPVCCRERLSGSLASDPVVSRRAQAALASGVLALSTMGPPVAMAQEPDQQLEGGSGAGQPEGGAEMGSGAVVPPGPDSSGGTVPPTEVVPPTAPDLDPLTPPEADGDSVLGDVVPVETDPIDAPGTDPAPAPGLDEVGAAEPGPDLPQPAPEPGAAEPDPSAETPEQPSAEAPEQAPMEAEGSDTPDSSDPSTRAEHADTKARPDQSAEARPRADSHRPAESPSVPQPSATQTPTEAPTAPAPEPVEAAPPAAPVQTAPASDPAPPPPPASTHGGRFLIVQPGDSLWAIAKRLLGPDASPAEIARKVNRLWELNRERIGTGRPDLVLVGTKLRLR